MRIVRHDMKHPYVVKLKDVPGLSNLTKDEKVLNYELHLCACGLSKHKPFCDGSHHKTVDEKDGEVYSYDSENNQHMIEHSYTE